MTATRAPSSGCTDNSSTKLPKLRLLVIAAPVLLTLVWLFVDANPTLFFFDLGLSLVKSNNSRFASLKGKTIWVTGASSGIGAELVCRLVAAEVEHGKNYLE